MEDGLFPWSNFFPKIKIRKPLGPSVGVNQMWTQRNDHASNSDCVDFCNICPKKVLLKEKKKKLSLTILLSSLVFIFSFPPKNKNIFPYHNNICPPWALPFSTRAPLLSLPPQNPLDHVGLKTCQWIM